MAVDPKILRLRQALDLYAFTKRLYRLKLKRKGLTRSQWTERSNDGEKNGQERSTATRKENRFPRFAAGSQLPRKRADSN